MWKIVIVEDEDLLREGLISAIPWGKYGFEVIADTDNGEKGVQIVYDCSPDVVISDIRMPVMDGLTMSEKIHEWNEDIKIVFISGYDEFEYARRAMKMGAEEYILKPVQLDQVETLLAHLKETLILDENRRKEYSKLREMEQIGEAQVREKLYRHYLKEQAISPQMQHYEVLLSEEEKNRYYGVMIIGTGNLDLLTINADYMQMRDQDHLFENSIVDAMGDLDAVMLPSSLFERILVFKDKERDRLKNSTEAFTMALEKKKPDVSGGYHVCMGEIYHYISGIFKSYASARTRLEALYIGDWTEQFVPGSRDSGTDFISYDKKELIAAIQSGSAEKTEKACADLRSALEDQKVASQLQVILTITSIFEQLVRIRANLGKDEDGSARAHMDDFGKIVSKGQRNQILENFRVYCLDLAGRFRQVNGQGASQAQSSIGRVIEYIRQEHGNPDLTIADAAGYVFISPSYLTMLLKKETGKTFIEYLTDVRMAHACELLTNTDMKSYHVAEVCGFANATYFSTVFKSIYGVTPKVYRKEHRLPS